MAQLTQAQKYENLGIRFILSTEGPFAVLPGQFGRVQSMSRLSSETNDSIKKMFPNLVIAEGVPANQEALVNAGGSPRGISHPNGDVNTLSRLDDVANQIIGNIESALKTQKPGIADEFSVKGAMFSREYIQNQLDKNPEKNTFNFPGTNVSRSELEQILQGQPAKVAKVAIGNEDIPFEEAYRIIGKEVPFSQAAVDQQKAAGEAAAAAKDAQVAAQKAASGEVQTTKQSPGAKGKTPTKIKETADSYQVLNADTGEVLDTVPFGDNKDVALSQALSRENQITTGSSPQVSGRPDLFAIPPTQAEIDAGIKPIVPQEGMAPVEPQVASSGDIAAVKAGTLPTPAAEAAQAGGTTTGTSTDNVDTSGLTPEEIAAADALASSAANSNLIYQPKVSPEDIDKYISEGINQAQTELDPYYSEIIGRAKEAYLQGVLFETQSRELELRQEQLQRQQELKTAQNDLEARGATFSGEAAGLLGEKSALPPELQTVVQGLLQKQQDLVASSTRQRFEQNVAQLTQQASELLGTQTVQKLTEQQGNVNPLTAGLFRTFKTTTPGSIAREEQTQVQTRGRELAQGQVARELAQSPDFPTEQLLNYL